MLNAAHRRLFSCRKFGVWPALILALAVLAPPLRAETPVFPPGSRIGLAPPAGLAVSPDFTGFMDRESGTSVVMTAMPREAFDQLSVALTAEQLATQGMTLLGPCDNVKTAFEDRCFRATQEAGGYLVEKWILIAKLENDTAMVVVNLPSIVMNKGIYSAAAIEAALSSLAYSEVLAGNPIDALPFTIEESELLLFQRTLSGSGALYAGPANGAEPQALWVVAASLSSQAQAREVAFSRTVFAQIATLSEVRISDEQSFATAGLEGHILEGTGKDKQSGADIYVFQAILVDASNKYYRMGGLVPAAQKALYRPEFIRLMQTLRPR